MKTREKDLEKLLWDQMTANSRSSPGSIVGNSTVRALPKLMAWFILFISITYFIYTLKLLSSRSCPPFSACDSTDCPHKLDATAHPVHIAAISSNASEASPLRDTLQGTDLSHIVFGIAASSRLWEKRKNYIKLWWKPKEMRGIVWLDNPVKMNRNEGLPPVKISGNTSRFSYTNRQGHRSAIRISRIVSETLRLGLNDVQWFVMGDDDTFFVQENLVRVLSKYDHREFYYIGSSSESHLQNIYFSYGMAYGGGGFAISYPLAKALDGMQDRCIQRYPGLYGSDDRMQACMSELGVPLTKEPGFHQYDVYGNLFGLLAAHPVTPLVSLHHLDVVEPIFPNMTRVEALLKLQIPMRLDSAGLMQQSICYEKSRGWTVSVSWGFSVQILRGIFSPREMEMPSRTFLNWYRRADYTAYAFNTRPVSRHPCQKPFVFYLSAARSTDGSNKNTVTEYVRHMIPEPDCKWKMPSPGLVQRVVVRKKSDPFLWDKAPRRNCCRILPSRGTNDTVSIEVGPCRQGEISQL